MIAAPRPWAERTGEEAVLLASSAVARDGAGAAELEMTSASAALRCAVVRLGVREAECSTHGMFDSTGTRLGVSQQIEIWSTCPGCASDASHAERRAKAAGDAAERRSRLEEGLARSALPERLLACSFENFVADTPEQADAARRVESFAREFCRHRKVGSTLVLAGNVGTGKGHLAGAALQEVSGHSLVLYTTLMGVIRMVRDTWRRDSARTETQVLADLARVDLLAIDEIGVQYGTDAEKTLLFEIMDRRYMDCKPTILLTNLTSAEFRAFVGDRIHDRLRETGIWVPFRWDSYRAKARVGSPL